MERKEAEQILLWARTLGNHGGNPYMQWHVKQAERTIALLEGRPVEIWASYRREETPHA